VQGNELGVTYTVINRTNQSKSLWLVSQILPSARDPVTVIGPVRFTVPAGEANCTFCHQWRGYEFRLNVSHNIAEIVPPGKYGYRTMIGRPPSFLVDMDYFDFLVEESFPIVPKTATVGQAVRISINCPFSIFNLD
jgi:hypothetical protein